MVQALILARESPEKHLQRILPATRAIAFLGTPSRGSALAVWAESLAKVLGLAKQTNVDIVSVLKKDSETLARIQDAFHNLIRARAQEFMDPIEMTCFFEELALPGVGVVIYSDMK